MKSKKLYRILAVLIFCSIMPACTRQAPQLPSNKGNQANPEYEALLKINAELAAKEDSLLKNYCEQNDKSYRKNELGFWYIINRSTNGKLIRDKDSCEFELLVMTLDKKILLKETKKIIIGKKTSFVGLEEGLKIMRRGEQATFVFPWYLAYGLKGYKSTIPPYTSLLCELKITH